MCIRTIYYSFNYDHFFPFQVLVVRPRDENIMRNWLRRWLLKYRLVKNRGILVIQIPVSLLHAAQQAELFMVLFLQTCGINR